MPSLREPKNTRVARTLVELITRPRRWQLFEQYEQISRLSEPVDVQALLAGSDEEYEEQLLWVYRVRRGSFLHSSPSTLI